MVFSTCLLYEKQQISEKVYSTHNFVKSNQSVNREIRHTL